MTSELRDVDKRCEWIAHYCYNVYVYVYSQLYWPLKELYTANSIG